MVIKYYFYYIKCLIRKGIKQGTGLLIISLCATSFVHAEIDHTHNTSLAVSADINLHEVVEKTFQHNPRIQVIQARLKDAEAQFNRTTSLWVDDPAFSVSHYNDALMNSNGLMEWEVGMNMPLWLPGQKLARQNTIEQKQSLINASGPALKLELAGIVRETLWHIALTKNQLTVAEKEWDIVKKLEQDVKKRVELGDLAQSDLILAQQESLSKEAAFRKAEQEYRHAQHRYDMITGLKVLPENFEESAIDDLSITIDHPALYEAKTKVNTDMVLREQIKLEKKGNPSLFVGTRHERATSGSGFDNAIGLNFSIPLGLTSHTTPKVTAAEVNLSESQSEMELLYRELNIAIQDASRELESTRKQYEFAQQQNELSKKNLAFSRKAFSLGESSLIELIRIQAQAFSVERNMHRKKLEMGLQTARLNQAKGIIP